MRRIALLSLITLTIAVPLYAAKGQSYFTYDDGGTIIRQADDNREIDARVNLPLFPGDEVITSRRGRSEIRLSDGNVLALDRSTDVRFRSILDSYDGDGTQTVVELRYGHIIVQRTDYAKEYLRIDTETASYFANDEAVYAVDSDGGHDVIQVFDGAVEVRTPNRTQRVRSGEQGKIDNQGLYSLVSDGSNADEFERWFLRRSETYGHGSSRYLDRSLAYADNDLSENGSWVYVNTFNTWCWRPRVAAGWRPYFYGEWGYGRGGSLIWISYEPWGWVPYHYGRWTLDPFYGWVWLPGTGYSPAWVYWMYGPDYVGWAPAGWWDCYRPYYEWCYRPNARSNFDYAYWFFGKTRVTDIDLRPWTFLRPGALVATRIDRGAMSTDLVRERVLRGGSGDAVITNSPTRFTRNDLRDPAGAINNIIRRVPTSGGSGATVDVTPFIRRDPDLSSNVRERILRRDPNPGTSNPAPIGSGNVVSGGLAPIRGGGGSVAPIGGGSIAPIGGGSPAPIIPSNSGNDRVNRNGNTGGGGLSGVVAPRDNSGWRDKVNRGDHGADNAQPITTQPTPAQTSHDEWRQRTVRGGESSAPPRTTAPDSGSQQAQPQPQPRDIPRRIIDAIGGARLRSGGDSPRSSSGSSGSSGSSSSGSSGSHDHGGSSSSGGGSRSSSGSSGSSSSGGGSHSSSGSSSSSGSHDHVDRSKP